MTIKIVPINAFETNYIWLLIAEDNNACVIVDPGDAAPILKFLHQEQLTPIAVLITHHHWDHTQGISKLAAHYSLSVYGSKHEKISGVTHAVQEGDVIAIDPLKLKLNVLDVPGHSKGHVAYYGQGVLFCGDTLFLAGCGRLFEGTPQNMYESLQKLSHLPDDTLVYPAHEYSLPNLRFAALVEPDNQDIKKQKKLCEKKSKQNLPTLPTTIEIEKKVNPFLRCEEENIIQAVSEYAHQEIRNPIEVFRVLRKWKDRV